MTFIPLSVPYWARSIFSILNFVACGVLIIIRVHHERKYKIQHSKLTVTGLSCLLVSLIYCLTSANTQMEWFFGDTILWCELSMKLAAGTYALYRFLIYIFVIFRLEVVNQANFVSSRIIETGKAVIVIIGIFMVVSTVVYTKGVTDQYFNCLFEFDESVLVILFLIDTSVCVAATWMFIKPITEILKHIESNSFRYILHKTKMWSLVSFISTMLGMLTVAVFDGAVGVFAFDCSITSFSLVMMMSPMSEKRHRIMEIETTSVPKEKPKEKQSLDPPTSDANQHRRSDLLNEQINEILSGDCMDTDDCMGVSL